MKDWTVVALYADNHQPYATSARAATVADAEREAQRAANADNRAETPLIIAGVIEGEHAVPGGR